jgi:hypothetical protein
MLFVITAMSPNSALSQAVTTLAGVVRNDIHGIAHAEVIAIDSETNERRRATTDERGFFRMLDLTPGRYAVAARVIGHYPVTQTVYLAVGQRAQIELLMERAASTLETVKVEGQRTRTAEVDRSSVGTAVTEEEIQNLPFNSRNVMELAAVAPGIRSFRPVAGPALPAAGAIRNERALNMYLDGVEMKNLNSGNVVGSPQTGSPIPADALQEFQVLLNTYDAEFTRGAAYVISAVTRRGTNQRHGSVFAFFQNKDLVSVNDFQRGIPNFAKPDFKRAQAGLSVRGPFIRNRLFYAFSYELSNTDNFVAVIPGRPASDPSMWDSYAGVFKAPNRNNTGLLRLTWVPNEGNLIDAIWSSRYFTGQSGFGGIDARQSAVVQQYFINTVKLRHRWIPTSRAANELSLQLVTWSHDDHGLVPQPTLRYPTIRIGSGNGFKVDEAQFRLVERLTYSIRNGPGSHLLKGGSEISRVTASVYNPINLHGLFTFRSETADPAEAMIGVGFIHPDSDRDASSDMNGWITGAYVNDEWHVTPRLVLNLGVRYDAEFKTLNNDFTVPWASDTTLNSKAELQGLLNEGNRKNDLNNFSPRASFSWDVSGNRRTFIRGGFGIMYDRVPQFTAFQEQRTSTWRIYSFTNPGTVDPAELRSRISSGGGTAVPPSMTLLPNKFEAPENKQWSVGLGAQLTRALALNMDYIDQDVRKLFGPVNLNWLDRSGTNAKRAISPKYGNIVAWGDETRARFRALLSSLNYAPDSTFRINLAYTLGSAKADWDLENAPMLPAAAAGNYYVLQRISGDERHRFVLSGVWQLGHGFGISTITTIASPRPYRTWAGQDLNKNSFPEDDWIEGRRYQLPDSKWSSWYRVVDLRLSKAVGLGRGVRMAVTAEAFNLFNTENYASYFGVKTSDSGEPRPDFRSPSEIFATRQLQLGTRLEF